MIKKILVVAALVAVVAAMGRVATTSTASIAGSNAGPDVGGKIAFVSAGSLWIYSGGTARQITPGPKDAQDKRDAQPSLSPNGTQVVYARLDEGFSDLYLLDLSNPANPTALTDYKPKAQTGAQGYNTEALWALYPAWSPSGQRIAYTTDIGTEYPGLYSMNPDGTGAKRLEFVLDRSMQGVERPSWSPDGGKIAVANYFTNGSIGQIWTLNLETGRWTALTNSKDGAYDPAWSPDGEWIAFAMRDGSSTNIYVVPTDAQRWTAEYPTPVKLTTDGASRSPAWSADGTMLAYIGLYNGSFDLYAAAFTVSASSVPSLGAPQKLTENANIDPTSGLSWSK